MQYFFMLTSLILFICFLFKRTKLLFLLSELSIMIAIYWIILIDVDFDTFLSSFWAIILLTFLFYSKNSIIICDKCSMVNRKSQKVCSSCKKKLRNDKYE